MRSDPSISAAVAHFWCIGWVLALAVVLLGCASEGSIKRMREVPAHNTVVTPQEGKALIVFVRPVDQLYAVQASVFHLTTGDPELVGILAAKTGVAYQTGPDKHLFMSVRFGARTEFMTADLRPNKMYYVMLKMSDYSSLYLDPVRPAGTTADNLQRLLKNSRQVEKTFESQDWALENMANIRARASTYHQNGSTPHLQPDDGW